MVDSGEKKQEEHLSLTEVVQTGLFKDSLDLSIDYSEITFDALLDEDGILKEIPFVKSLVSVYKIGRSVRDLFFAKKFMVFLSEFHKNGLSDEKINGFRQEFETNESYREEVIENLMVIIEKIDSILKSKILARLFIAYIDGHYDWDTYRDLSACVERLMLIDLKVLNWLDKKQAASIKNITINQNEYIVYASTERLTSYGFIEDDRINGTTVKPPFDVVVRLSRFGSNFYNLCVKNLID